MLELATLIKQTKAWACYDCGKCTATCPITRAGGNCTPRRHVLATNLGQSQDAVHSSGLFSCLTCAQCDRRCPAQVAYTDLVQTLREMAYREGVEPE